MGERRGKGGTPGGRFLRRNKTTPLLSVVVPVFNAEEFLDECLDSLRNQHLRNAEFIVVDDGSTDGSWAIAERHQLNDPRIRLVRQANAGSSAARNAGIAESSGKFLTFVDADDTVAPDGFACGVTSLQQTSSDIAVLAHTRLRDGRPAKPARWHLAAHTREQLSVAPVDFPQIFVKSQAWSKIFARRFWDDAGLSFEDGMIYEDQLFSAQSYRAAHRIDILSTVAYHWRVRPSSMSQGQFSAENLSGWFDALERTLDAWAGVPSARETRLLQYLRNDAPPFLLRLERDDEDYLDVLIARLPAILAAAPAERFDAEVPAQFRVLGALLVDGDRDRVRDFVRAEGMQVEMHPSGTEAAGFTAYLPGWGRDPVPADAYVLTVDQTRVRAKILGGHRLGDGQFSLDVQGWFQNVALESSMTAAVRADGVALETSVMRNGRDTVVESRQGAERRYPGSGWTVTVGHASGDLPKLLEVELSLTAGPFAGSRTFAKFRSSRIEAG